jgi:nitroimidazol reductase NimA-like FMN-containing flavoprotein (pyridoxamine 5'-phosphate oxidase superfamily)
MTGGSHSRVLEGIPHGQCLSLLRTESVGRIAVVSEDGQPIIFPVNYALEGDTIVVRTDEGTKLDSAALSRVAFEVDKIEDPTKAWSVLVRGTAFEITHGVDEASERLRSLPLDTWAPGPKLHWIKIVPKMITGRRLRATRVLSKRGQEDPES